MDLAVSALAVSPDALNVVARLFVAPECRRAGVGQRLLDGAAADARGPGAIPILDVWDGLPKAIALYERCGLAAARRDRGGDAGWPPVRRSCVRGARLTRYSIWHSVFTN